METWRYLPIETRNGYWNMALDEAILKTVIEKRSPNTLRFFKWKPSTINIGRNQSLSDEVEIKIAKEKGLYYQIDRYSPFGNPYFLDSDGDRDQVCDGFADYFKHKRSLHDKLKDLKGKALGCHCAPLRCHGDHLKKLADAN